MYDRVLVPTDGSDSVTSVVEHAYSHAEQYGADLHVLHVIEESESASIVGYGDDQQDVRERRAQEALEPIVDGASERGLDVTGSVEVGTPYRTIVSYANEHDVDLIVMSTHGRSGVDRFLMGSVTERVLRTSDVPVMAVRHADRDSGT